MKLNSAVASALLVSAGLARSIRIQDEEPDDGALPQRLKVNAFVIHKDGTPAVECWEVSDDFGPTEAPNHHGMKGPDHQIHVAGAADLSAVALVTWPSRTRIWPPTSYYLNQEDVPVKDYCYYCNSYPRLSCPYGSSGPITINCNAYGSCTNINRRALGSVDPADSEVVLTPQNGNNWFYFHDARADEPNYREILAAEADDPPFILTSAGATNAQVISMEFNKFKNRTKLHEGACNFGGVETPDQDSNRKHAHLDVNLRIQEL